MTRPPFSGLMARVRSVPAQASVSALALSTLALNFVTQTLAAALLGAGNQTDAFFACLTLPTIVSGIVTTAIVATLIPQFTRLMAENRPKEAWLAASGIVNLSATLLFAALAAGIIFGRQLLQLTVGGLPAPTLDLATSLVPMVWAATLLAGLAILLAALLQARRRFLRAAIVPALGAVVTLGLSTALIPRLGVAGLAAGTLIGAIIQVAAVVPGAFDARSFRLTFAFNSEAVRHILRLSMPLLTIGAAYQSVVVVDRYLAAGLAAGTITYLALARKVIGVVATMIGSGISAVAFVSMSEKTAKGDMRELIRTLSLNSRVLWLFVVPCITILIALRESFVSLLFQHGQFTAADSHAVTTILPLYLVAMIGMAFGNVVGSAFYALQDTRTTSLLGLADVAAYLVYMPWLARTWGYVGISTGVAIYYSLSFSAICLALWLKLSRPSVSAFTSAAARVLVCAVAAGIAAAVAATVLAVSPIGTLCLGALSGAAVYIGLLRLARVEEFHICVRSFQRFLSRPPASSLSFEAT